MNKKIRLLIVVFFGVFGVHKFIDKDYKMGFIYLFTGGLLGIGWIIDIIKEISGKDSRRDKCLMSTETLNMIRNGQLPIIAVLNINLQNNEVCYYTDVGYTFKDKTVTTGYTGKSNSVSIRMKNLTYRTGNSGGKAIRETQRTTYTGILYITNKRIIYSSNNECFDKPFDKITSITEVNDGVILQIGASSYSIIVKTHSEFIKVFNMIRNKK